MGAAGRFCCLCSKRKSQKRSYRKQVSVLLPEVMNAIYNRSQQPEEAAVSSFQCKYLGSCWTGKPYTLSSLIYLPWKLGGDSRVQPWIQNLFGYNLTSDTEPARNLSNPGYRTNLVYIQLWIQNQLSLYPTLDTEPTWLESNFGYRTFRLYPTLDTEPFGYIQPWIQNL